MTTELERSALDERASSSDGRTFEFTASPHRSFLTGSFVVLTDPEPARYLGQIERFDVDESARLVAVGRVLGAVQADGVLDGRGSRAFAYATVAPADDAVINALNTATSATLDVGSLLLSPGVPGRLIASRFNRHTFWCGQSGSGKTYALGVLLEELLIHTALPMVVFDPNGDFVKLTELREGVEPEQVAELQKRDVRILRPGRGDGDGNRLCVQFTELSLPSKAALLRLDPLIDRAEYNTLLHIEDLLRTSQPTEFLPRLRQSADPSFNALALRIENLDILSWEVWALGRRAVTEIVETRPAATVLDLGGFRHTEEPLVVALALLDDLWARREERRPLLLVIDEAHNLCSPDAETPLQRAVLERIIQIAAEGRKFGLWLLLSTQRPSKVHQGIISQCDNLALMRMSSQRDLDELGTVFGFAPPALLAQSPHFRQGESLFAGGFAPAPSTISMRQRFTQEGGRDVSVPALAD